MLSTTVLRTIRRYRMLPRGGRVVVALSGGPDSVALLHLLHQLQQQHELVVAGIAHFNHRLRAAEADADEHFCRETAASLSLPILIGGADVRQVARHEKRSIEDAARRLRYAFLTASADVLLADRIAVGHSREDQAETFLLRLFRGAGTRGLSAIRPRAGRVIRPLLETSRAELRTFATEAGLQFREDATNADRSIPRNRIRHDLLPYLEREFCPGIVEVLAREAVLARLDGDWLETEAIKLTPAVVLVNVPVKPIVEGTEARADRVVVEAGALRSVHPAIVSRVLQRALEPLAAGRFVGFNHVARVMDLIGNPVEGRTVSLPGQDGRLEGGRLVLRRQPARQRRERIGPGFSVSLSIPGEADLQPQRMRVAASWADRAAAAPTDGDAALVQGVTPPLIVRSRRPGDRFQPPGMQGHSRKLQDYFVDRKVARHERDLVPLVVDANDRIVWVIGHGVSEAFRAVEPSPGVILLKARRLGGEG